MVTEQIDLAMRLREAREAAGFTQDDVAKALNLFRPSVAQIEAGKRKLTSIEFMALSRLYGRSPQSFFEESFEKEGVAFVLRAIPEAKPASNVREGLDRGIEIINSILEMEKILGRSPVNPAFPGRKLPPAQKKWDAIIQGQTIADQERNRLKLGTDPIGDPAAVMEGQGILVLALELPESISGFTFRCGEAVVCVVNSKHPSRRQRYSLAHEYCHAVCDMEDQPGVVSRDKSDKDYREVRADVFAAGFLMPEEGVRDFLSARGKAVPSRIPAPQMIREELVEYEARRPGRARDIDFVDVIQMAQAFGVSREAALWRLRNLDVINAEKQEDFKNWEKEGYGRRIAGLFEPNDAGKSAVGRRSLGRAEQKLFSLAIEAANADLISRNKMIELLKLAGLQEDEIFGLPQALRNR